VFTREDGALAVDSASLHPGRKDSSGILDQELPYKRENTSPLGLRTDLEGNQDIRHSYIMDHAIIFKRNRASKCRYNALTALLRVAE
jgi:hypothetical protein